ncbi:MAG: hypothetical protein ACSW74_00605, partial [Spirochaetales bacterium]
MIKDYHKEFTVTSLIQIGLKFIMATMVRKRVLAVLALLLVTVFFAAQFGFAAVATRPSVSVRFGGS